MHIKTRFLLALTAVAALFVAAPVASQDQPRPFYDLAVKCTPDEVVISKGVPDLPVALAFGFRETKFWLPDNALLRVEPLVFAVVGKFNIEGKFSLPLHGPTGNYNLVPGSMFFMQALSYRFDFGKICTAQLVGVTGDGVGGLRFIYLG